MIKLIILTEHPELYSTNRFIEEAKQLSLETSIINPYEQNLHLINDCKIDLSTTLILHRTTGIRYENFDIDYSIHLEGRGAVIKNSPHTFLKLRDKMQQTTYFQSVGIKVIPSWASRKRPRPSDIAEIKSIFSSWHNQTDQTGYIVKTLRGNQGIGLTLIWGEQSLLGLLETHWARRDQKYLVQPFIRNAPEYRVLLSNNKILGVITRTPAKDEFRANSDRGNASLVSENQTLEKINDFSINLCKKINVQYCALDIMLIDSTPYLIELNLVPGFKQMETFTKKNIAKIILTDILKGETSNGNIQNSI